MLIFPFGEYFRPAGERMNLTKREKEIFYFLLEGKSNKQIAKHLAISHHTVRDHISSMLRKCNASSRLGLVLAVRGIEVTDYGH